MNKIIETGEHDIAPEYIVLLNNALVHTEQYIILVQSDSVPINIAFNIVNLYNYDYIRQACVSHPNLFARYRISAQIYWKYPKLSNVLVISDDNPFNLKPFHLQEN